jgi:polysaccharide biosynthesis protein PslE
MVPSTPSQSVDFWSSLSPAELVSMVVRRWPSVLATTVVCTAIAVAALIALPNQYASDGAFYVRLGRGAMAADPTSQSSQTVSMQESRSTEVASILEMLNGREIADRVVREVGAREINHPRTWIERLSQELGGKTTAPKNSTLERTEYDQQIAHEEAVARVRNAVGISIPKIGYTVNVAATTADPHLSQRLVQSYLDNYGDVYVEAHQATGSFSFFEKQTEACRAQAVAAQEALQKARSETGWMSLELSEKSLQSRILELELALDQSQSELADAEAHSRELKYQLEATDRWVATEVTSVANQAADGMKTALLDYQMTDNEKLSRVTPGHPRYKILQDKLEQGEKLVGGEKDAREETVEAINPIYLTTQSEYQKYSAKAMGLQGRRDALLLTLEIARSDLKRLNQDSIKLADLDWTAKIAEKNYLTQSERLESARITSELDRQKMSDVSVIQNASLNLKKVGPKRALLSVLAAVGAFALGIVQAVVRAPQASKHLQTQRSTGRTKPQVTISYSDDVSESPNPRRFDQNLEPEAQAVVGSSTARKAVLMNGLNDSTSIDYPTKPVPR